MQGMEYKATTEIKVNADAKAAVEQLRLLKKEANLLVNSLETLRILFQQTVNKDYTKVTKINQKELNKVLSETIELLGKSSYSAEELLEAYKKLVITLTKVKSTYSLLSKEVANLNVAKQEKELIKLQDAFDRLRFSLEKAKEQKERWTSAENIQKAENEIKKLKKLEDEVTELIFKYKKLKQAKIDALKSGDELSASRFDVKLKRLGKEIDIYNEKLREYKKITRNTIAELTELSRGKWFIEVTKRALAYASIYGGIYTVFSSISNSIQVISELDNKLRVMQAVLGISDVKAKNLQQTLLRLSETLGVAIEDIQEVTIELGRAGIAADNLASATKVVASMALMTGDSLNVSAGALITFLTNYKQLIQEMYKGQDPIEIIGNKLMYVANASKLTTQDIATLSNYAVASSRAMGLTIDALGALSIAMSNAGNNASTIGTNIRRLQKLIYGSTKETIKLFQQLGLSQEWLISELKHGLDGTIEGVRRSNEALKTFITSLMSLSDEQFNRLTADMDVLLKQTLTTIRNTGQVTIKEMNRLFKITKGQLDQALVIANSFANSWVRIKIKVIEFVNSAKPLLQDIINLMNKMVNLFISDEEQKANDVANKILLLENRLKALKEAGLENTNVFKRLNLELKELKKQLTELNTQISKIDKNKAFFGSLEKGLKLDISLSDNNQVLQRVYRKASIINKVDLSDILNLEKLLESGKATKEQARQYVEYLQNALKYTDLNKRQFETIKAYLQAITNYYHLFNKNSGNINNSTKQTSKHLNDTLDKVNLINNSTLTIYQQLVNAELKLGQFNHALQTTKDLFNLIKTDAKHFENSLNSLIKNKQFNSKELSDLQKVVFYLKQIQNAKSPENVEKSIYKIRELQLLAKQKNEKWANDRAIKDYINSLINGYEKYVILLNKIKNAQTKVIKEDIKASYPDYTERKLNEQIKYYKIVNDLTKKQQNLLKQLKQQYIGLLPPKEQIEAWYKDIVDTINKTITDPKSKKTLLELALKIKVKKEQQLEVKQEKDNTIIFNSFEDIIITSIKKIFEHLGKQIPNWVNTLINHIDSISFIIQKGISYLFDKTYDKIKAKYTGLINNLQQSVYIKQLQSKAYNTFGYQGYGVLAEYQANVDNIKMLQAQNAMNYELMKKAKHYKEITQYTLETLSIAAGTAAAIWFDGGAVLEGIKMAIKAQDWAEQATGFKNFQQAFIEGVDKLKQAVRDLADNLIQIAGSVYKSIKDYRSIFDKLTGSATYKIQQYKESISYISQFSDLTVTSLSNLTQKILEASKDFVDGVIQSTDNFNKLVSGDVFTQYGLAIEGLNDKFKESLNTIATLIDVQKQAKDAIADYIAELKGSLGDTQYQQRYTQQAFAQALQDYYSGKIDGSTLLEKAKAYQAAGGDVSKIIKTLQGVEAQSTKDYLKGILNAVTQFNAVGLPESNIKELQSPKIQTLNVIKDTKNILERVLNILSGGFDNFGNLLGRILINVKEIIKILKNILKSIWESVLNVTKTIWKSAFHITTTIWKGVTNITKTIWNAITKLIKEIFNAVKSIPNSVLKPAGDVVSGGGDLLSGATNLVSNIGSSISHVFGGLFADGGYTGSGIGYVDKTGYPIAGVVHAGEWVAPAWMVNSMPNLFNALEGIRVSKSTNNSLFSPVINVAVDLTLIKETNFILTQQLSIQKKMLRLLQKFDEEGIKCVS